MWSPQLKFMRNGVKAARRRFQRETRDEDTRLEYKLHYKKAISKYITEIAKAKRKLSRSFLELADPRQPFGTNYKFMRISGQLPP